MPALLAKLQRPSPCEGVSQYLHSPIIPTAMSGGARTQGEARAARAVKVGEYVYDRGVQLDQVQVSGWGMHACAAVGVPQRVAMAPSNTVVQPE